MAKYFDQCIDDEFWGEKSWEKAESKFVKETVSTVISKSGIAVSDIDYCFAGDLLNQCISSSFGLRELNIPFFGVFGACSTFVESMCLGSVFVASGAAKNVLCATSSHFCSAEKQFRFPLELGNQRPPTSQWTVTGSGAVILSSSGSGPYITHITPGKIVDMGIKDANNMGAAMAPAALSTLVTHFRDTGRKPSYYDAIITGDLGNVGKDALFKLLEEQKVDISDRYYDCGMLMYDTQKQDVHAGGSGCGCSATVLSAYLLHKIEEGEWNRILFVPTGALLNKTSFNEGQNVPGIAHGIVIEHVQLS